MPKLAYQFPVYAPAMRIVTAITNAFPAVVTTSFAHNYITGLIVRLDIPVGFGMQQINQQQGEIIVTGDTTFSISIDATLYDTFQTPIGWPASSSFVAGWPVNAQSAQCVPVGEDNSILTGAVVNQLPY